MEHRPAYSVNKTGDLLKSKKQVRQMPIVVGRSSEHKSTKASQEGSESQAHNTTNQVSNTKESTKSSLGAKKRVSGSNLDATSTECSSAKSKRPSRSIQSTYQSIPTLKKQPIESFPREGNDSISDAGSAESVLLQNKVKSASKKPLLVEPQLSMEVDWPIESACYEDEFCQNNAPNRLKQASFFRQAQWVIMAWMVAIGLVVSLFATKPKAVKVKRKPLPPLVEVEPIERRDVPLSVNSQGVVLPTLSIPILSEVNGRVVWVSPEFDNGGFFEQGEKMVRIERTQYELDLARARSNVASARQQLLRAKSEVAARQGIEGLETNLLGTGVAQITKAEAFLEAALAEVKLAQVRLERTDVVAPFTGLVQEKLIGLGQVVTAGGILGQLYSTDEVEVRLPLNDAQRKLIQIPFQGQGIGPKVVLTVGQGSDRFTWDARITRAESQLNERNRMLYVVATLKQPFLQDSTQSGRPPLSAGTYVDAQIAGNTLHDVWMVPLAALKPGDEIWAVNGDGTLKRYSVEVVYKDEQYAYVAEGLSSVDRVIVTSLDIAMDGMAVRVMNKADSHSEQDS